MDGRVQLEVDLMLVGMLHLGANDGPVGPSK